MDAPARTAEQEEEEQEEELEEEQEEEMVFQEKNITWASQKSQRGKMHPSANDLPLPLKDIPHFVCHFVEFLLYLYMRGRKGERKEGRNKREEGRNESKEGRKERGREEGRKERARGRKEGKRERKEGRKESRFHKKKIERNVGR